MKAMCREIRSWNWAKRSDKSLGDLALMFNSIVRVDQLLRALLPLPVAPLPAAAQRPPGPVACRKYHKRLRNRERRAMELLAGAAGAQDLEGDPAQWIAARQPVPS
jgi:RNA-directed DNA polymerase